MSAILRSRLLVAAACVAGGALLGAAFPARFDDQEVMFPVLQPILGSCGLFLLMLATRFEGHALDYLKRGLFAGLAFSLVALHWMLYLHPIYLLPPRYAHYAILSFPLIVVSLQLGLWLLLLGVRPLCRLPGIVKIIAASALWVSFDVVRCYFLELPWGLLATVWVEHEWLTRSATIWGLHGVSFFWLAICGYLAYFDLLTKEARAAAVALSGLVAPLIVPLLFPQQVVTDYLRVGVVQPNLWPDETWGEADIARPLENIVDLTRKLESQSAELILWPQGSYPEPISPKKVDGYLKFPTPILTGAFTQTQEGYLDSALLLESGFRESFYDRQLLLPFIDFMPLGGAGVNNSRIREFRAGDAMERAIMLPSKLIPLGILLGAEDRTASIPMRRRKEGAELLISLSIDNGYWRSSYGLQTSALNRFRAIETGLPLVRVSSVGPSQLVLPNGHSEQVTIYERGAEVFEAPITRGSREPLYSLLYPLSLLLFPTLLFSLVLFGPRT